MQCHGRVPPCEGVAAAGTAGIQRVHRLYISPVAAAAGPASSRPQGISASTAAANGQHQQVATRHQRPPHIPSTNKHPAAPHTKHQQAPTEARTCRSHTRAPPRRTRSGSSRLAPPAPHTRQTGPPVSLRARGQCFSATSSARLPHAVLQCLPHAVLQCLPHAALPCCHGAWPLSGSRQRTQWLPRAARAAQPSASRASCPAELRSEPPRPPL